MLLQILSLLLVLLVSRVLWRRWKYDLHKIPSPPGHPLFGHTLDIVTGPASRNMAVWMRNSLNQLGNPQLMKVSVMGTEWLIVTDMHFIKDVMMSRRHAFPKFIPVGGGFPSNDSSTINILTNMTETSPYVTAVRRVYLTAFNSRNLRMALPKMIGVVNKAIDVLETKRMNGPVDVQSLFEQMALDVVGDITLGVNAGGLDGSNKFYPLLLEGLRVEIARFYNPFARLHSRFFKTSKSVQRQMATIDAMTAEWDKVVKKILDRDDPTKGEEPIWHSLKTFKDPVTNEPLSYEALRAELASVVFGGVRTTSRQLSWIFAILASHPDAVDKLLEELKQHGLYGPKARELRFDDLGKLEYLTAVIKEGMRLGYIFRSTIRRRVPKDMTILGYRVPQGTLILAPGTRVMNVEEEWEDPNVFKPERWMTDDDMTYKYSLGFAFGPRECVGQRLAIFEMKVAIIKLVTHYQLKLEGSLDKLFNDAVDEVMSCVKDGIWVHVTPRRLT